MQKTKEVKSYELLFENGKSVKVLKRSNSSKFYVDPGSIDDTTEEFPRCLEIGSIKLNPLCLKLQEIFESKIIDII